MLCKLNSANLTSSPSEADYDLILSDIPCEVDITKKQAAIIVHEYMRKILNEDDTVDVSEARKLKDLFDCRVCVQHIEQMYCKGIFRPMIDEYVSRESGIPVMFGGNELLKDSEADEIVEKVYDIGKRINIYKK